MEPFKLTSDQWDAVVAELAKLGHTATEADRAEIEASCGTFIQDRLTNGKFLPNPGKSAREWEAIRDMFVTFKEGLRAYPDQLAFLLKLTERQLDFIRLLEDLQGTAEQMAKTKSKYPQVPNRSDPDLDDLQRTLISFWVECGGIVASSTADGGATPGGPLLRFLQATYVPAVESAGLKTPTGNALQKIIRKIQRVLEDNLLEALHQVAAGKKFTASKVINKMERLRHAGSLVVKTIHRYNTVAGQAKWTDWWTPSDPGYWPVALDWGLRALRINDAIRLDKWLKKINKNKKNGPSVALSVKGTECVWTVIDPVWPIRRVWPSK